MVAFADKKSKKIVSKKLTQELRMLKKSFFNFVVVVVSYMQKKYISKRMYNNIYNFSTFSETLISLLGICISWNFGGTL